MSANCFPRPLTKSPGLHWILPSPRPPAPISIFLALPLHMNFVIVCVVMLVSVYDVTSHSTHNRSFRRRVFPGNPLHWYWQPKTIKHNTTYTRNTKEKRKKTALANKTIYTLIWYAFYDLRSGNGVDPILTSLEPTRGCYDVKLYVEVLPVGNHLHHTRRLPHLTVSDWYGCWYSHLDMSSFGSFQGALQVDTNGAGKAETDE